MRRQVRRVQHCSHRDQEAKATRATEAFTVLIPGDFNGLSEFVFRIVCIFPLQASNSSRRNQLFAFDFKLSNLLGL